MSDVFSKEKRSEIMSSIRSENTKPELLLKKLLMKFSYQPNSFGKPDFISNKRKTAVFVDGCFWHKCPLHFKQPKQNSKYWIPKLNKNVTRAREVDKAYQNSGWKVIRIWEHEIKRDVNKVIKKIKNVK